MTEETGLRRQIVGLDGRVARLEQRLDELFGLKAMIAKIDFGVSALHAELVEFLRIIGRGRHDT